MMSIGSDSSAGANALLQKVNNPHPITRTWRAIDATSVLSTFTFTDLPLLRLCDEHELSEARAGQQPHHLGDRAVIRLLVGPHINAFLKAAARVGDRLQLRNQLVHPDLGIVDERLAAE